MRTMILAEAYVALSALAAAVSGAALSSAQLQNDFYPPFMGGGFQLLNANNGLGEPLNVSLLSTTSCATLLTNDY